MKVMEVIKERAIKTKNGLQMLQEKLNTMQYGMKDN